MLLYRAHADDIVVPRRSRHERRRHPLRAAPGAGALAERALRGVRLRGPAGHRDRRHLLPDLHRLGPHERPAVPGHLDRPVHLGEARPAVPGLQHLRAAARRRSRRPWSKAGAILADPDRRPLPDVLRRGLDLLRVVRRPDPLDAVPAGRAADAADAEGHVRRVPRRGRPAADHHQQRADPAAAQRRREVRGRHRPLHLRAAAVRPEAADRDHGADELPVARAVDVRGPARPGLQRDLRRGARALQRAPGSPTTARATRRWAWRRTRSARRTRTSPDVRAGRPCARPVARGRGRPAARVRPRRAASRGWVRVAGRRRRAGAGPAGGAVDHLPDDPRLLARAPAGPARLRRAGRPRRRRAAWPVPRPVSTAGGTRRSAPTARSTTDKTAYEHAFVVLAAASATAAGRPGGRELLDDALRRAPRALLGRRATAWSSSSGTSRSRPSTPTAA